MKKDFEPEPYCFEILSRKHRGALAKFRSGTAPIKVETGWYQTLNLSERVCFHCAPCVEDEEHVLILCPLYEDLRCNLLYEDMVINPDFESYNSILQKMCFLLSDSRIVTSSARVCTLVLERRGNLLSRM